MPRVFGEQVTSVEEIVGALRRHGDDVRGIYRARYFFDDGAQDPYTAASLERPTSLQDQPPGAQYPWEQVFVAAATCAGSDYPMLARHGGVPLRRVTFEVEGLFDPRGEFEGLDGLQAPADARPCFLTLHLRATLVSDAPRAALERIHRRVVERNMVLGALRGIPRTHELVVERPGS